jgi:hypothetical protein
MLERIPEMQEYLRQPSAKEPETRVYADPPPLFKDLRAPKEETAEQYGRRISKGLHSATVPAPTPQPEPAKDEFQASLDALEVKLLSEVSPATPQPEPTAPDGPTAEDIAEAAKYGAFDT